MPEAVECYLCSKKDVWICSERDPDISWSSGGSHSLPHGWCHDYHDEGQTIYFCSDVHRTLWKDAAYLSWQAVKLLQRFAKTMLPKEEKPKDDQHA